MGCKSSVSLQKKANLTGHEGEKMPYLAGPRANSKQIQIDNLQDLGYFLGPNEHIPVDKRSLNFSFADGDY